MCSSVLFSFQLHHTGIKTAKGVAARQEMGYFNCTIQELKLEYAARTLSLAAKFQLHHTGIKT